MPPLRPLREDGQPKLDKELTANEQASRAVELKDDEQIFLVRAHRAALDAAALENYNRSLAHPGKR